ncbi:MAG: hypothetical protein SOI44_07015 [Lactimicrobium sp.]|uniref:hypothetical protein n=1 Tax=Lactimicrobium sp. TaxID=2563780 RepID=UPI002F351E63
MAAETANVLACAEPEVKTESIVNQPVIPSDSVSWKDLTKEQFNQMMQTGLEQAKAGNSKPADVILDHVRKQIRNH